MWWVLLLLLLGRPAWRPSAGGAVAMPLTAPLAGGQGDVVARVISSFGAPRDGGRRRHLGVDVKADVGTPVYAAHAGRVSFAGRGNTAGLWVGLDARGVTTRYLHLDRLDVRTGDNVTAGQQVGTVGTTGNATGGTPHLHYEVHMPRGRPVDPLTIPHRFH